MASRLLHARARELGKEIQVISPDRQVRAVAKAAGFRVSQPQEGSSISEKHTSLSHNVDEESDLDDSLPTFIRLDID
jgi:hypothetical protein